MGIAKDKIVAALHPPLPLDVVTHLLDEYTELKQHFAFGRFRPSELNGGRFAECVLRLLQHLDNPPHTPVGMPLGNGAAESIANRIKNNTTLHQSLRFFIPHASWLLMDIRNRRDVGHVGGDVSPNLSDSLYVVHSADWILTEIVRIHFQCPIAEAQKIVASLNETQIPLIAEVDGFLRVQNTTLKKDKQTLALLYHSHPDRVSDTALCEWIGYSTLRGFQVNILEKLHEQALVHYKDGCCSLYPKGIAYVEKHIDLHFVV